MCDREIAANDNATGATRTGVYLAILLVIAVSRQRSTSIDLAYLINCEMLTVFCARRLRPGSQIQLKIGKGRGGSSGMSDTSISLVARWIPKAGSVDELRGALTALA
jgi:hypothetical protein